MDMSWDAISGISSAVSAIVAIMSLIGIDRGHRKTATAIDQHLAVLSKYLLFCSGWVLSVIAFNWCFDPFGPYITAHEEKTLYGIMLSVPALTLTAYAWRQLQEHEPRADR